MLSRYGPRHILGAADANVVAGVGAATATAVGGKKVIPAVVIDQVGGFAVDRDVERLVVRIDPLARLRIKLNQADDIQNTSRRPATASRQSGSRKTAGSIALQSSTPSDEATTPPSSHL